jgi:hypothetical protein
MEVGQVYVNNITYDMQAMCHCVLLRSSCGNNASAKKNRTLPFLQNALVPAERSEASRALHIFFFDMSEL